MRSVEKQTNLYKLELLNVRRRYLLLCETVLTKCKFLDTLKPI